MIEKPKVDTNGHEFSYGLIDGTKAKLDILPRNVLPKIPGYSPIKTTEHFFVERTPIKAVIDGKDITNPELLRTRKVTIGAARTEFEARKLMEEFQAKHPDDVINYRAERGASFERVVKEHEAHADVLRQSMQRGERLPTINGPARIEDRLKTLVDTTQALARQNALLPWEQATRESFVKDYGDFLPGGEFPNSIDDIVALPNMTREEAKQFANAQAVYHRYAKVKSFETLGDGVWKDVFHNVADVLEKFKIPAPLVRDLANKGNLLAEIPKQVASTLFIHLNPIRQWIIQPAQVLEMYAISPLNAPKNLANLSAFRMALASEAPILKGKGLIFKDAASKAVVGMDKREFNATLDAIKTSGILQSVDLNMLVHGVVSDASKSLKPTHWETAYNSITAAPKAVTRGARMVGFDFAELNNRIGMWLQVKDIWKEQNPGKDWNTLEARETIAVEALKLSGAMNRAGSLPYQSGALSVVMQFAAISQKITMNLLQDNATILSPLQRSKLAAARATLWGAKYGMIGGAAAYYFIDRSENEVIKEYAEVFKRGLADRATNMLMEALTDSEADISVGKSMTPYGQRTTGMPYIDTAFEMAKLFDDNPQGPSIPALAMATTLGETIDKMQSWFITKDVTGESWNKAVWEATKVASGMNNFAKSTLMLAIGDKITKNGNHLGMKATAGEAIAQAFGFSTWNEENLWESASLVGDHEKEKKEMATNIYNWIQNQDKELAGVDITQRYDMINSFLSVLRDDNRFTETDIQDIAGQVFDLDKQVHGTVKDSVMNKLYKNYSSQNSEKLRVAREKMNPMMTEDEKELINILEGKGNP
jgi:hypothetical protein